MDASPVAVDDVARVVAAALVNPAPYIGKTYHLTGPRSETMNDVAREYSKALGRAITYHNIAAYAWRDALIAHGLPAHVVHHPMTIAELHRAGRYDSMSSDVRTVSAQSPMTVEQFVQKNAGAFTRLKRRLGNR